MLQSLLIVLLYIEQARFENVLIFHLWGLYFSKNSKIIKSSLNWNSRENTHDALKYLFFFIFNKSKLINTINSHTIIYPKGYLGAQIINYLEICKNLRSKLYFSL